MSSFEYETFEEPTNKFEALVQMACWVKQLEEAKLASEEMMKSFYDVDESESAPKPKKRVLKRAREVAADEEQDVEEPPKKKKIQKTTKANKNHILYLSYLNTFPEFEGKMNEEMRKQVLLDDRYIGKIVEKRLVQCAGCKQNRKLDADYAWNNWKHHRQNCKALFETWLKENVKNPV